MATNNPYAERVDAAWARARLINLVLEALKPLPTDGALDVLVSCIAQLAPDQAPAPTVRTVPPVEPEVREVAPGEFEEVKPPKRKRGRKHDSRKLALSDEEVSILAFLGATGEPVSIGAVQSARKRTSEWKVRQTLTSLRKRGLVRMVGDRANVKYVHADSSHN